MIGSVGSNPYRNTFAIDPRVAYYFSEAWGFEVFYQAISNSSNGTYDALRTAAPNALPNIREITAQYGAMVHWVPWYAKINFFNEILYFDWYLEGGAGSIKSQLDTNTFAARAPNFQPENLFAIYLGTGHQYHLSQHFIVRLDVLGSFYQTTSGEKRVAFQLQFHGRNRIQP